MNLSPVHSCSDAVAQPLLTCLPGQAEEDRLQWLHEHQTQSAEGPQEEKRGSESYTTTLLISHRLTICTAIPIHLDVNRRDVLVVAYSEQDIIVNEVLCELVLR